MKREARSILGEFTPEQKQRWQEAVREEEAGKAENIAHAKEILRRRNEAANAELARVAELLKQEHESQGLSLNDNEIRNDMNKTALCRIENLVQGDPTIATLIRIAEGLGKTLVVGLCDKS